MTVWMPCIATGTGAEIWTRRLAEGLRARGLPVQLDVIPHAYQYCPWAAPVSPPQDCNLTLANSWSAAAFAGSAPLMTVVHHVVHDPALSAQKTLGQAAFHRAFVGPMERLALQRSATVVCVSESTSRAVADHLHFEETRTILNGVDTGWFTPCAQRKTRDRIELLFVGKPSRRKRFDLVARLAAQLGERAHLTVIGSSPEAGLPLPQGTYLGRVSDDQLREAYRDADFLLLPSTVEGFGYAAAEALACGTPVVCAPEGAVAEIAQPGLAAVTVADDISVTARTLVDLATDRASYRSMRDNARQIAVRDLSENRWLDEMESIVRTTMKGSEGRVGATDR